MTEQCEDYRFFQVLDDSDGFYRCRRFPVMVLVDGKRVGVDYVGTNHEVVLIHLQES